MSAADVYSNVIYPTGNLLASNANGKTDKSANLVRCFAGMVRRMLETGLQISSRVWLVVHCKIVCVGRLWAGQSYRRRYPAAFDALVVRITRIFADPNYRLYSILLHTAACRVGLVTSGLPRRSNGIASTFAEPDRWRYTARSISLKLPSFH